MKGRIEHDNQTHKRTIALLSNQPEIISRYYYARPITNTESSKYGLITAIIRYSEYLKEHGRSIEDFEFLQNQKSADFNMYVDYVSYKKDGTPNEDGNKVKNMKAVKSFYEFLAEEELISKNPFLKYKMPKDKKERPIITLNEDEIEKVKNSIQYNSRTPERDLAIFVLGIRTGLRISSIREINIEDINWEDMSITVTEKCNVTRNVYFGQSTKFALQDWIDYRNAVFKKVKTSALFLSNRGERISYNTINYMLKQNTYMLDKKITPHKLRGTFATNLYDETEDIYITADALGHKNLANTRRYARIDEKKRRKAAEIMDNL